MRRPVGWASATATVGMMSLACSGARSFERAWVESGGMELVVRVPTACSPDEVQVTLEQRLERREVPHAIQRENDNLTLRVVNARVHPAHLFARHEFFVAPVVGRQRTPPAGEDHWYPSDTGSLRIDPTDRIARDHITGAVTQENDWGLHTLITFDDSGATQFADLTTRLVGQQLAMVYDGKVLSAPYVNEPIREGQVIISADLQTLNDLTIALTTPTLPCDLTILSETTVSPP